MNDQHRAAKLQSQGLMNLFRQLQSSQERICHQIRTAAGQMEKNREVMAKLSAAIDDQNKAMAKEAKAKSKGQK